MTVHELKKTVENSGIVGAGGGGFPTHMKLDIRAKTVVLNCAECEPLVNVDQYLLANYTQEIISALSIISQALDCDIVIAIKKHYVTAVSAVNKHIEQEPRMGLKLLEATYPAGDEILLLYEALGIIIPPGAFPIESGCIVLNVETVYNIHNAIANGAAVTHKWLTIAGEVEKPVVSRVPVGTSVPDAVKEAGSITTDDPVFIVGGAMMGDATSQVITKTTNAILVLPRDHYLVRRAQSSPSVQLNRVASACCQCRSCTDMCPRYLLGYPIEPHKIMRAASARDPASQAFMGAMYCGLCGLCEMVACPQSLAPRSIIKILRTALVKAGVKAKKHEAKPVSQDLQYRKTAASRLKTRLGLAQYDIGVDV